MYINVQTGGTSMNQILICDDEKDIVNAVFVGNGSEETAHGESSLSDQHIFCRLGRNREKPEKCAICFAAPAPLGEPGLAGF